eukprot:UN08405
MSPGSYRLAVSLFSQMNALIIESCKIHGNDTASFYQELKKSYSPPQTQEVLVEIEEEKVIEPSTKNTLIETKTSTDHEVKTEKTLTQKSETIKIEKSEIIKTSKSEIIKTEKSEIINTQKPEMKMDYIEHDETKSESLEPEKPAVVEKKFEIEISPAPNSTNDEDDKLKPLLPQQSVIIHDVESSPDKLSEDTTENEQDREVIEQQLHS